MSIVMRSLLRDPLVSRPLTRALRRFNDDWWLDDPWTPKRVRRAAPEYDQPLVLFDDMSRQMHAAMNRMQEFAEDLEALDALANKWDKENTSKEPRAKRRRTHNDELKRTESGDLQLSLDVSEYRPEDLKIKLVDDNLVVEAVTENSGKNSYRKSHMKRWFKLPEDCKLEEIKSKLTEDNQLLINLPSNKPALEQNARQIPIEMSKPSNEQGEAKGDAPSNPTSQESAQASN